jgi:hypothetical protein
VAEGHVRAARDQHARGQALVDAVDDVASEHIQQPGLDVSGHDRDRFEQPPRRTREARRASEHRVAHRLGDRLAGGGERLDDEERVAAGSAVELLAVGTVRLGERENRRRRERRELEPCRAPDRLSQYEAQLLVAVELVVAVAGEHEHRNRREARGEQRDHVERRLIGPVHVLEDQHSGRAAKLCDQRRRDLVRSWRPRDELLQLTAGRLGDVQQRSQRTRRAQGLARAPQDARGRSLLLAERAQERRLADAGLAADEHQPPVAR